MAKKYTEEQRLKALGLLKLDQPLIQISEAIDVPYATLHRWRAELEEADKNQAIQSLVDVSKITVQRIAKEVRHDFAVLTGHPDFDDLSENEPVAELMPRPADPDVNDIVGELTSGIDGYQQLSTKLQDVASNLAGRIDALARVTTGPMELQLLVESLAKLQVSFFNKNVTNVNVLNAPGAVNGNSFGGFKNRS